MRNLLTLILAVVFVTLVLFSLSKTEKQDKANESITNESTSKEVDLLHFTQKKTLTVAIDNNISGVFTLYDNRYGYQYELVSLFAKHLGKDIEFINIDSNKSISKKMSTSEVDITITSSNMKGDLNANEIHSFASSLKQNYVVLKKNSKEHAVNIEELKSIVGRSETVIIRPFKNSELYDLWLDSVSNSAIISTERTEKLISQLLDEEFDVLVCDALQASLATLQHKKELSFIYSFDSEKSSSIYIGKEQKELERQFISWYASFSTSYEHKHIAKMYDEKSILKSVSLHGYVDNVKRTTSPFDRLFKAKGDEYGEDWRFLSAIAYGESRYNPKSISRVGAIGLMQIMPRTALNFNVNVEDIAKPEVNVEIAIKLIQAIEKGITFKANVSNYDKKSLILAAYNAGIGHVFDARRLAVKYGEDPDSWKSISKYLKLKSTNELYINDELVRNGRCRSGETIAFVSTVMNKYENHIEHSNMASLLNK